MGGRAKIIAVNDGIIRKTSATVLKERGSEMGQLKTERAITKSNANFYNLAFDDIQQRIRQRIGKRNVSYPT